jgi:hypothetical protein
MSIHGILLSSLIVAAALFASLSLQPSDKDAYASDAPAEVGQPFSLKVNQTAHIESAGIDVMFVNVTEDSRCPSDVTCVWAGQVAVIIDVNASASSSQLTLTLSGGQSEAKSFGNYSIMLADVQPYPVSTKKISLSDYVATLVVDAGNQVMSHGVFVKAKASGAPITAVVAGWNVEKGKGAAVLFMQDGGLKRVIIKFVPSYSGSCSHEPDQAECIDGQVTFTSNGDIVVQGGNVHVEVDGSKTRLFLTLPGEAGKEYTLDMMKFKSWSRPIISGGNSSVVSLTEGQRDGPLLVQKIYPDRIEGLNFPEYPIATDKGFPITLRIGEKASNGCTVILTLVKIEGGSATFLKTVDENRPCPICWLQVALTSG